MMKLKTNRDLYLAINELCAQHKGCERDLETYLRAVLRLLRQSSESTALSLDNFHRLLSDSFTGEPATFEEAWRCECDANQENDLPKLSYDECRLELVRQIVDLREMAETGTLENQYRYFGLTSPRGNSWYNFDPCGYIECAMCGSLGGWEPDDDTGRSFVSGECAVLDADGKLQAANPEDIERPINLIPEISWQQLEDFFVCGRIYE